MNIKNMVSLEAYNILETDKNTILVDVRTTQEWQEIGTPKLNKAKIVFLSWQLLPNMSLNQIFQNQFTSQITNKLNSIFFLCRSGTRSLEAIQFITNIGYTNCYNIIDGFEGNIFGVGWKQSNLPWEIM